MAGRGAGRVKSGDQLIVRESKRVARAIIVGDHPALVFARIIASLSLRVIALIAASRFSA